MKIWWCQTRESRHQEGWNVSKEDSWEIKGSSRIPKTSWMTFWYAKRSDMSPLEKTWYIPHHCVYHLSKPKKNMCRVWLQCRIWETAYESRASFWTRFDKSRCWSLKTLSTFQQHSWLIRNPCIITSRYQIIKKHFLNFCAGIMVLCLKNHKILWCTHMYLVGHHLQFVQTMLLENCCTQWVITWKRCIRSAPKEFLCRWPAQVFKIFEICTRISKGCHEYVQSWWILPYQVHFKQPGVAFVNPRESEKN